MASGSWCICRIASASLYLGFSELKKALASLPVQSAILDGEIVCLDSRGVSQFNALLERKGHAVLYAFDLLWHDGQDLRQLPLIERKDRLAGSTRKM
jgi:bifunctional non-homologous end joining protein LigD